MLNYKILSIPLGLKSRNITGQKYLNSSISRWIRQSNRPDSAADGHTSIIESNRITG